jgi:hypothetical protein
MPLRNAKLLIPLFTYIFLLAIPPKALASDFSLGIYPPATTITMPLPADLTTPITLENFSDIPLTLDVSFRQFSAASSQDGQIQFVPDTPEFTDLRGHIAVIDDGQPVQIVNLAPKQKKTFMLRIINPSPLPPKDYSFSIIFTSSGKNIMPAKENDITEMQTTITAGVATNVLFSLGKRHDQQATIQTFSSPRFVQNGPISFTVTIANKGEAYIKPSSKITITNLFNKTVRVIPIESAYILSQSSRSFSPTWDDGFIIGPYTATLQMSVTEKGPTYKQRILVFAFPIKLFVLIASTIFVILLITSRVKKHLDR